MGHVQLWAFFNVNYFFRNYGLFFDRWMQEYARKERGTLANPVLYYLNRKRGNPLFVTLQMFFWFG